jgi:hypothetical protein
MLVPFIFGAALFGSGRQEHASILYYVISFMASVAVLIATALLMYAGMRVSAVSVRRRPRWLYGLLALAYCAPIAIFVFFALGHARAHTLSQTSWAAVTFGLTSTCCAFAVVAMLGRALAPGRLRRAFWLFPPQWLDHDLMATAPRNVAGFGPPGHGPADQADRPW